MDIFMQLEKENGDLFINSSKRNQSSFAQPSKLLTVKTHSSSTVKVPSLRRALGNVNQHMQDRHTSKVKQRNDPVNSRSKKTYPDIETFIPYNPLDFETSDIPEEHRLSDRSLAGIGLFISSTDAKLFGALTDPFISPLENEMINYDAYEILSPVFEDLTIVLPPVCDF